MFAIAKRFGRLLRTKPYLTILVHTVNKYLSYTVTM